MGRRLLLLVVCLAVSSTGMLTAPGAAAVPVWTPAVVLGAGGEHLTLASNPRGDVVAVWDAPSGVSASFRPVAGGWSAPRRVSDLRGEGFYDDISFDVVLDDAGRATVLWTKSDDGCNGATALSRAPGRRRAAPGVRGPHRSCSRTVWASAWTSRSTVEGP
jgi:hypothetical protein